MPRTMNLRKTIFWIHLSIGVTLGAIILFMCATGMLLAYRRQIEEWSDRAYRTVPVGEGCLGMQKLLAVPGNQNTGLTTITVRSDPAASVEFAFGREHVLYVNPYTGAYVGKGSIQTRSFFNHIVEWHRWLGGQNGSSVGGKITAACNLGFFFLLSTGPFLWWPKKWLRRNVANIAVPRFRLSGRAREWNWHHVAGIWCVVPLLIIVLTAIPMSYGWANNLLYRITGNEPPQPQENQTRPQPGRERARNDANGPTSQNARTLAWSDSLDTLWSQAEALVPGWQTITMRVPNGAAQNITFMIDAGNGGRPDKKFQLLMKPTGETIRLESFSTYNEGRKLRFWARWLHTGEAGGFFGQCIAFLAAGGGVTLGFTGLILALRRWFKSRRPAAVPVSRVRQPEAILD
jgi:uncharacterized iron-regulated membrane protein